MEWESVNRRELFASGAVLPLVGFEAVKERAYMGGSHQCEECLSAMFGEMDHHRQFVTMECPNSSCSRFGVKCEVYDHASQRPSAQRYEPIRALCSQFERPFSVLDIGSNYGYFDVRLMSEFPECVCVLVDDKTVGPVLQANNVMDRSVVLSRKVSAEV